MYLPLKRLIPIVPLLSALFLSSCASLPQVPPLSELKAYGISGDKSLLARYSPLFIVENHEDKFNLIGTVVTQMTEEAREEIFVNHGRPTIYTGMRNFKTSKGSYTNLIYRIHFEKVPFGLIPFHIGQGKNVGLLALLR